AGSKLFKSDDRGDSWTAISPDLTRQLDRDKLPVMGKVWGEGAVTKNLFTTDLGVASALAESPRQEGLLWVGTDDGLIQVTVDGGKQWLPLRGAPTVAFRDLAIHKRENDLVAATFGRGFYVLDDYTPLRHLTAETLAKPAALFPPRKTYVYEEKTRDAPGG